MIEFIRIGFISLSIFAFIYISFGSTIKKSFLSKKMLIAVLIVSIAMGVDYVLFQVLLNFGLDLSEDNIMNLILYFNFCAAIIFIITQSIGLITLLQVNSGYLPWVLPAVAYLFFIGLWGLFHQNEFHYFIGDTVRSIIMLTAIIIYVNRSKKIEVYQ